MPRHEPPQRTIRIDATRFRHCPSPDRPARLHGDVLQLVLAEGITARDLLQSVDWARPGRAGKSGRLAFGLVELAGIVITSLALMITLGVFDVFGNAAHHVIGYYVHHDVGMEDSETRREQLLLLGSMAAIFAGLTLVRLYRRVPLFEENVESVGHAVRMAFDDFFNSDSHLRGALRGRLKRAGIDRVRAVEIWNANASDAAADGQNDAVVWRILLPALRESIAPTVSLTLLVRSDEYDAVARKLAASLPGVRAERVAGAGGQGEPGVVAPALIPPAEREWLPLLRLAAFPAAPLTADTLSLAAADHVFSESHFLNLVQQLRGDDPQRARAFLLRCQLDYGFLVEGGQGGYGGLDAAFLRGGDGDAMAPLRAAVHHALNRAPQSFLDAHDPLSHLAVINALCGAGAESSGQRSATERYRLAQLILTVVADFLECIERTKRYDIVKYFFGRARAGNLKALASHLPAVVGPADEEGIAQQVREDVRKCTRFNAFSYDGLMRLGRVHEVVGNYADALAVWRKLETVDARRARIRIARLSERAGNFAAAAGEIGGAIEEFERRQPVAEGGQVPLLAVETYLEGAWVILSAGDATQREECRRRLDQAQSWLGRLEPGADALIHWRYFNYLGLYHDWQQEYGEALAQHRRALSIPGVRDKWYSGSLVNLAYVQRKQALSRRQAEPQAIDADLEVASTYASLAVDLKRRIGDDDELPVALHNLALTRLCGLLAARGEATAETAAECARIAHEGLAILDRLGSSKKRFALLLELWLAERLTGLPAQETTQALRALDGLQGMEAQTVARLDDADALRAIGDDIVALRLLT